MKIAAIAFLALLTLSPGAHAAEVRALWVTRWDYRTEQDVEAIAENAAKLGVNRLLFQVRGQASTFYPSKLEPWSERLGGADPGFDPLAVAVREARKRGLEIEAWINVLPLWKGTKPPNNKAHPFHLHPEWRVVGSDGEPQRLNAHYVCANPARADVRAHVAAVAGEIAGRYEVDAVHLDYVRYVTDLERNLDFSHDPVSLAKFGKTPAKEKAAWKAFRADQVTETVRAIREAVRKARPACGLTAAVFPTHESRKDVGQDVVRWVREGLIDAVYPMTYAHEMAEWEKRLAQSGGLGQVGEGADGPARSVPVIPGIAVQRHPSAETTWAQVRRTREVGTAGFALFCYASFYSSADTGSLREPDDEKRRRRVAAARADLLAPR